MTKVKELVADLLKLNQEDDICIGDEEGYYSYNNTFDPHIRNIRKDNGYKGYVISTARKYEGEVKL